MGRPVVGSSRQRGAPPNDQAGFQAPGIRIASTDEIAAALDSVGLRPDRRVIVPVGGAGGTGEKAFETVAQVQRDEIVPVAERRDAVVIDGRTDSRVMQLIRLARSALGDRTLIGLAAEGTVLPRAGTSSPDAVEPGPNHTLFLLVTRHALGMRHDAAYPDVSAASRAVSIVRRPRPLPRPLRPSRATP